MSTIQRDKRTSDWNHTRSSNNSFKIGTLLKSREPHNRDKNDYYFYGIYVGSEVVMYWSTETTPIKLDYRSFETSKILDYWVIIKEP